MKQKNKPIQDNNAPFSTADLIKYFENPVRQEMILQATLTWDELIGRAKKSFEEVITSKHLTNIPFFIRCAEEPFLDLFLDYDGSNEQDVIWSLMDFSKKDNFHSFFRHKSLSFHLDRKSENIFFEYKDKGNYLNDKEPITSRFDVFVHDFFSLTPLVEKMKQFNYYDLLHNPNRDEILKKERYYSSEHYPPNAKDCAKLVSAIYFLEHETERKLFHQKINQRIYDEIFHLTTYLKDHADQIEKMIHWEQQHRIKNTLIQDLFLLLERYSLLSDVRKKKYFHTIIENIQSLVREVQRAISDVDDLNEQLLFRQLSLIEKRYNFSS